MKKCFCASGLVYDRVRVDRPSAIPNVIRAWSHFPRLVSVQQRYFVVNLTQSRVRYDDKESLTSFTSGKILRMKRTQIPPSRKERILRKLDKCDLEESVAQKENPRISLRVQLIRVSLTISLTGEHRNEVSITDFGVNVVFEKIFDTYFPLSAIVDVDGVETTFKVRGVKHISLNISEMIEDNNFSTN